jgi:hypothetical protein
MREYDAKNAEARTAKARASYLANADEVKAANSAYRKANLPKVMVWNNARRAAERRATPAWADTEAMACFYELAAIYAKALGEAFHVDHIVPLRGKRVCGLHVQDNLQVLPAAENLRKGAQLSE